jgi:26S proteasome regulatory subunit T2
MSFVDKELLEPGCSVLLHQKVYSRFSIINIQSVAIVGVLADDVDPLVSVMKMEKAPTESYADIGGLENQIQEIKVLFLTSSLISGIRRTSPNTS